MTLKTMMRASILSKVISSASVALVSVCTFAVAAEDPRAGQLDARVRFVDYRPYQVVRVTGLLRARRSIGTPWLTDAATGLKSLGSVAKTFDATALSRSSLVRPEDGS